MLIVSAEPADRDQVHHDEDNVLDFTSRVRYQWLDQLQS